MTDATDEDMPARGDGVLFNGSKKEVKDDPRGCFVNFLPNASTTCALFSVCCSACEFMGRQILVSYLHGIEFLLEGKRGQGNVC